VESGRKTQEFLQILETYEENLDIEEKNQKKFDTVWNAFPGGIELCN